MWDESVLPGLGGLAKAMYAAGHIVSVDGDTVVFALPNDVHRQKCEQKRAEVESALVARVGRPLSLRLVVDGGGDGQDRPRSGSAGGSGASTDDPSGFDDDPLGGVDVHDLDDAPDAPSSGIDALIEAFPGAQLSDESS